MQNTYETNLNSVQVATSAQTATSTIYIAACSASICGTIAEAYMRRGMHTCVDVHRYHKLKALVTQSLLFKMPYKLRIVTMGIYHSKPYILYSAPK